MPGPAASPFQLRLDELGIGADPCRVDERDPSPVDERDATTGAGPSSGASGDVSHAGEVDVSAVELELAETPPLRAPDVARARRRRLIAAVGCCSSDVAGRDVVRAVEQAIGAGRYRAELDARVRARPPVPPVDLCR